MMLRRNTKDPMTMHMADGGITRWANGLRMADGGNYRKGSMNGGRVVGPGTGVSDSVPARYSNGEYVLPADTAAAIGHEQLDAIKDATHTPAAVQRGLRGDQTVHLANGGASPFSRLMGTANDVDNQGFLDAVKQRVDPVQTVLRDAANAEPAAPSFPENSTSPKWLNSGGAVPEPVVAPETPIAPAASRASALPGKNYAPPKVDSATGRFPYSTATDLPGPTPEPAPTQNFAQRAAATARAPVDALSRAGTTAGNAFNSATTALSDAGTAGGRILKNAVGPLLRGGSNFLGAVPHAAAYVDGNVPFTDKLRIGATDITRGLGTGAGSIVGGAAGTAVLPVAGSIIGGIGGGIVGDQLGHKAGDFLFGGDDALRRNKYDPNRTLIDSAKDAFAGKSANTIMGGSSPAVAPALPAPAAANPAAAPAAANPATAPAAAAPATSPISTLTPGDATMPGQDPGRGPLLRGMGGTEIKGALGVSKFTQGGKTLYSNVTTPGDNDSLMSGRAGVSIMPGMSQQAINNVLGGQSAGQTSADNQIRAANLRDGVDMERGTSQEVAGRAAAQQEALARSPLGTPGRAFAQKQMIAKAEQETVRRGQDITERDSMRNNDVSLRNNKMNNDFNMGKFQVEMGQKDREFGANRFDAANTQSLSADAAKDKATKDFTEQVRQSHTTTIDGKPVVDEQGANQTMDGVRTMLANQIRELQGSGNPNDKIRAKNLQDNDVRALSPDVRAKAIAAVQLMNKVNASADNLNPLTPNYLGTTDPRELMDMKQNSGGDYLTNPRGNSAPVVIPKRFLDKQNAGALAGRVLGIPTNQFNILKDR